MGSPSDHTAPSANVYSTVSGSSEVTSKEPNSSSRSTVPSGPKYQKPRRTGFSATALAEALVSAVSEL